MKFSIYIYIFFIHANDVSATPLETIKKLYVV